jgi:hypothetical protein
MPLIICPDCGHQCSPSAAACTDCGRPIAGSVAPPPAAAAATIAKLARSPHYGRSNGASILIALSVMVGMLGLLVEFGSGRASFGTYIVAILFGIWARLAQAHAHHRAVIDSIRQP